jgi:PPOX class probable F420-dependent enzyme
MRPGRATDPERRPGDGVVPLVTLLAGLFTVAAGVWALAAPRSFAGFVDFPPSRHFVHDAGAFQLGIGVTLLLALAWRDGPALALAGFLTANTVHAANHAADLALGGHAWDAWALLALSGVTAVALGLRLRRLGYVVGEVGAVATPELARFARQKTALLTTYRRDGTPVGVPLSVVADGDRLLVRSYERAGKVRRIEHNPAVEIAPSTARGRPTGPPVRARARRLGGAEDRRAAWLLARKYPGLQGILVPFGHRAFRSRFGRTVHFELVRASPPAGYAAQ